VLLKQDVHFDLLNARNGVVGQVTELKERPFNEVDTPRPLKKSARKMQKAVGLVGEQLPGVGHLRIKKQQGWPNYLQALVGVVIRRVAAAAKLDRFRAEDQ
jgi:hypothetical protein